METVFAHFVLSSLAEKCEYVTLKKSNDVLALCPLAPLPRGFYAEEVPVALLYSSNFPH